MPNPLAITSNPSFEASKSVIMSRWNSRSFIWLKKIKDYILNSLQWFPFNALAWYRMAGQTALGCFCTNQSYALYPIAQVERHNITELHDTLWRFGFSLTMRWSDADHCRTFQILDSTFNMEDTRKIQSIIRRLKSKISALKMSLQKAPSETANKTISYSRFKPYVTLQGRDALENSAGYSSPSRQSILRLKNHFHYQIEILFDSTSPPSLLQQCAYNLGYSLVDLEENQLDEFYEFVPLHCRRYLIID